MKNELSWKYSVRGIAAGAVAAFAVNCALAQTMTTAYDVAASYTGTGFTGNQGSGFGPWILSTYTFSDLTTSASFSGTLAGTNSEVEFLRANQSATAPSDGQDFKFNTLEITSTPEPASAALAALGGGLLLALNRRPSRAKQS